MKTLLACSLGLLLIAGVDAGGDGKKDLDKLQGKWLAKWDKSKVELTIAKDKFTFKTSLEGIDDVELKGTVKLDTSKTPRQIYFTVTEGKAFVGETILGIYELNGDALRWSINFIDLTRRPTEFPATPGGDGGRLYVISKRVK